LEELPEQVSEAQIDFGLITVPPQAAQGVADLLVRSGIRGILNFAPVVLEVPREVPVENVDFLAGLSRLAFFALNPRWREEMIG
jgi:redox-sensing transcriptional repressor